MEAPAIIPETAEYRIALVQPDSNALLVADGVAGYRLPRVCIPCCCRAAWQIQKALQADWGLHALVLDFVRPGDSASQCAVAEVLAAGSASDLMAIELDQVPDAELAQEERRTIASLLGENAKNSLARIGWIHEASAWIEAATGRKISSKGDVEQYNTGKSFALLRFHSEGWNCWLKATGTPNTHELAVTSLLSRLCGSYLPEIIDTKLDWNAWLTSGEAKGLTGMPADPFDQFCLLENAVESMAELQVRTVGHGLDLLAAGALDQREGIFEMHSGALFAYLEEAMCRQTSTKAPPLERRRSREVRKIFDDSCGRMSALGIPNTIVHGDMNLGNILSGPGHCQFIDWCEAYVGNPLITLQHLLLLNQVENLELRTFIDRILKDRYRAVMLRVCDPAAFDEAVLYMPLLAAASALYGRGDRINAPWHNDPRHDRYARSIARHMDRAARNPELLKVLAA